MSVSESLDRLKASLESSVIGQERLINRMLIALLVDGHLLVEGAPGLAKTRAIKALSDNIAADYQRVQFTPDLLPADLTGTEVYRPADGSFVFQQGPLFNNLVLADEINRAPAKVQSALQEGTYPLPEAQLDRFLMHVVIGYPDASKEADILRLVRKETLERSLQQVQTNQSNNRVKQKQVGLPTNQPLSLDTIFAARREVLEVHMAENVEDYIVRLITSTRTPESHTEELRRWISYGASPRATIALDSCARAAAWLQGRDYVSPADVQFVIHDVLRHRILLSYEAEADAVQSDDIVDRLLQLIAVP